MQERLRQLESATSALITDVSLDGVLHHVVQVAAEVIGARYAASGVGSGRAEGAGELHDVSGSTRRLKGGLGPPPSGHGVLGLVIHEGKPNPPNGSDPAFRFARIAAHRPPMRSLLGVPLGGRRGVLGNLYLTEKNGGESFTDEDEDLAILLAAKARRRIEKRAPSRKKRARLLEEVQQLQRRPSGSSRW